MVKNKTNTTNLLSDTSDGEEEEIKLNTPKRRESLLSDSEAETEAETVVGEENEKTPDASNNTSSDLTRTLEELETSPTKKQKVGENQTQEMEQNQTEKNEENTGALVVCALEEKFTEASTETTKKDELLAQFRRLAYAGIDTDTCFF